MSYGLGAVLEPAVGPSLRSDWPLMVWHRCEGALVHDATTGRWRALGQSPRVSLRPADPTPRPVLLPSLTGFDQARYERMVKQGIDLIRSGDVYQVNLAHTLDGHLAVAPREFAASLLAHSQAWFGAHLEHVGPDARPRAVCSASPESFIEVDPVRSSTPRRIVTRPMKGTLAGDQDPRVLERSRKDRAELDMIIDLMRNDLGRVCATGTVRVEDRRAIERHGPPADGGGPSGAGVWQGVGTVAGALRPGVGLAELLRALIPAGSITGAPKIRAMQIIEQIESRPRGPYCGAVGFVGDDGRVSLNVAIRTALVEGGQGSGPPLVSYSVGAGIVADSDPRREWNETMQKAAGFLALAVGRGVGGVMIQSVEGPG